MKIPALISQEWLVPLAVLTVLIFSQPLPDSIHATALFFALPFIAFAIGQLTRILVSRIPTPTTKKIIKIGVYIVMFAFIPLIAKLTAAQPLGEGVGNAILISYSVLTISGFSRTSTTKQKNESTTRTATRSSHCG